MSPNRRDQGRCSAARPQNSWVRAGIAAVAVAVVALAAGEAKAVPVFARKYETSCQTCHVAFPKLNAFGEAFRRNGHRWPAGEEEKNAKQDPVRMGQEAHKRVFPDAIWPNDIPSVPPVAVQMGSMATFDNSTSPRLSFQGVGANFGLNVAATLGDTFSVWAGAMVMASAQAKGGESTDISLERVFVTVTPFDTPVAILRVGRIEPGVLGISSHRTFGLMPWITASTIGDDNFTLEPSQLGLEASGVFLGGRFAYSAGVVEGANTLVNAAKDVYGRVSYKIGGMRLDGVGGATTTEPWREHSLTFGVFGYRGQARIGDPTMAAQEDPFWLAGVDANYTWRDANLIVAYELGNNARPQLANPELALASNQLFAQLDYVVFPWLIPTVRFERRTIGTASQNRISGGVYALLRANVRVQAIASAQGADGGLAFGQVLGGLNLAF